MLNFRVLLFFCLLGFGFHSQAATAKTGNHCLIEPKPGLVAERIYGANPIITYLLMALAPETIIGWNFPPPLEAQGIFPAASLQKPVVGGWFGQGRVANVEAVLQQKPELMVISDATVDLNQQQSAQKLGIPTCYLTLDNLADYPAALRDLGRWIGREARAEKLASYAEQLLAQQNQRQQALQERKIPVKTVYYAESPAGLETECRGSVHAEVVELAAGQNPHQCPASAKSNRFGKVQISFEQLVGYQPDAIVTQEAEFFALASKDSKWQMLTAVKNQQIFLVPQTPFRWMDRPPSFMRLLAMQWLMAQLYPAEFDYQIEQQTKQFFAVFFDKKLTDQQVNKILQGESL